MLRGESSREMMFRETETKEEDWNTRERLFGILSPILYSTKQDNRVTLAE